MNERLKALYKSVILKHNQAPYRYTLNEEAQYQLEAYNALCGDRFTVYFDIEEDRIQNISFHGFGCAISKASASVLVQKLEGQTLASAQAISQVFFEMIEQGIMPEDELLAAFAAAKDFPGRSQCATLVWEELKRFLD